jgi:hypothetical protein
MERFQRATVKLRRKKTLAAVEPEIVFKHGD